MAPSVSAHPTDKNVTRLETFSLTCEGIGRPIPEIMWSHNGSAVNLDQEHVSALSMSSPQKASNTLTVSMADTNTSGLYHCTVSAPGASMESKSALVLVQGETYRVFWVLIITFTYLWYTLLCRSSRGTSECNSC